MEKWIKRIICAVILAGLLITAADRIFIPKYVSENQDGRIVQEFYKESTPLDVVFFGTSTVYNAVSPAYLWNEYGFTSYTRAGASQTLWQTYYLLRDTAEYNKPSLVVCDMSFMKFGADFVEEPSNRKIIDGMRFSRNKMECVDASIYEDEDRLSYIFPILRFHSRWKELTAEDFEYAFKPVTVTYDGFIPVYVKLDKLPPDYGLEEKDSYDLPDKAVVYLQKIIDYCKEENITLLLEKTPTYINNWYPQYDEQIEAIAEKNGITYINFDDYKDEIGIDRLNDYNDGYSHFNVDGAERFCDYLGKYLQDNYGLKDRRTDISYSLVWDKKYKKYEKDRTSTPMETTTN